jgi:signal transduction histidine kinase
VTGPEAAALLRSYPVFEALSDEQLEWLAPRAEEVRVPAGTVLFREGDPPQDFWVLIEGELEIRKLIAGADRVATNNATPGVWAGSVPLVDTVHQMTARASRASRLFRISQDDMAAMLANGFPIARHLLLGVRAGTERFQSALHQQEKLTALGKLAAGLAHELNNPASAAQRAASELRRALDAHRSASLALSAQAGLEGCRSELEHLQEDLVARAASAPPLDAVARGDREDELAAWLEAHGHGRGLGGGVGARRPRRRRRLAGRAGRPAARAGPAGRAAMGRHGGHRRRAPGGDRHVGAPHRRARRGGEEVLVHGPGAAAGGRRHEGLETTLTTLRHKLRDGIEVERDYAADLPRVSVHGSDLNQVWTNLLDNAIDAMGGAGRIRIRTFRLGDDVAVEITDDGPGIPPELQSRVFDPFFTTKGPGEGTGVGLDLVYRTVVRDHNGYVYLSSEPGATTFRVRLPVHP